MVGVFILFVIYNWVGEIRVEFVDGDCIGLNGLMVCVIVIIYIKVSSIFVDWDIFIICWGDGICEWVVCFNGFGSLL